MLASPVTCSGIGRSTIRSRYAANTPRAMAMKSSRYSRTARLLARRSCCDGAYRPCCRRRGQGNSILLSRNRSGLARDQEDAPAIRKRLEFASVKIVTTADGVVSPLMHGLRTIIDSQYLDDLKSAVRRGMSGVIRDGRHAGGAIYGYRSVPGRPGELQIVPEQAEIIRRIFREYIAGNAPRAIAGQLNSEGVPPPRKSYWRASTINGHSKRKTGTLQNELYCGRLIWNRAYRVRDPDTGQRIWRYRAEIEWQRAQAPHLRIVDEDLFEAAQRLRAARAQPHLRRHARPKRILSGLLRCGCCGAGMSKKDIDHGRPRIVCTRMQSPALARTVVATTSMTSSESLLMACEKNSARGRRSATICIATMKSGVVYHSAARTAGNK